jgi:choline dehydrogenase-like flavoprotein
VADVDVLVIGAGAAGAAASWRLATAGLSVACLEQGDWIDPRSAPTLLDDWERRRLDRWHPNPNLRRQPADYPVDDSQSPIRPLMFNGVGGSTIMWSCLMPRFRPSDFRARTLDGVADDWPLAYDDLAPYYALNEAMMGVAGLRGDPSLPDRPAPPFPPAGLNATERRLAAAADALGWHWWPADIAIATRDDGGRSACNNCGPCELYCPRHAKGSVDVTYWPAALRAGARVVTNARVFAIETDRSGRATGAAYYDGAGTARRITADAVVLAANGVGTARLLLLSRTGRFPNGLANSSGLVGRNLMLHPLARVTGVFADPVQGHRGIAAGAMTLMEFYDTDRARGFARGCKLHVLRSHGPAFVARGSTAGRIAWGRGHHERFAAVFDRTLSVSICADDLPELHNRVVLHDTLADAHGIPAPRMIYRVSENSRRTLDFGIDRARALLAAGGARELVAMSLIADAGFHLMGTARMGTDPGGSVVNRFGRAHDVPNLFIVDAAVFVTAAAVNPTNTLQALALRTADHIVASRR